MARPEGGGTVNQILRGIGARDGLARLGFGLRRARKGFRLRVPERLLIAPQELAASDPAIAADLYAGQFILAGRSVLTQGQSPFAVEPPSPAWAAELHGFEWLRHFRDSESPVLRQHARALVVEWLHDKAGATRTIAEKPGPTARRVLAWLVNSPLLLAGADHAFYHAFLRRLAIDAIRLEAWSMLDSVGPARLNCAIAASAYSLCALTGDRDWKRSARLLGEALAACVQPDGAPLSRNPRDAVDIASQLLPLRNAYGARGRTPPPELQPAIDRLMAFIRLLRHPSGEMALFNGMGATQIDHLGALLAFDDTGNLPPAAAPYGGYQRAEGAGAVLIVDTGGLPPGPYAHAAAASPLAFELSVGRERLVVSCGAPNAGLDDMREALRETAAHSTLSVEGTSAFGFRAGGDPDGTGRRRLKGKGAVLSPTRDRRPEGDVLVMSFDGYRRSHGFIHRRELLLAGDGSSLQGIDQAVSDKRRKKPGAVTALRFHLHPRVRAAIDPEARVVRLQLADGAVWAFEAGSTTPLLDGSIFFGGLEAQRGTQQIVVPLQPDEALHWSFVQITGPS